MKSLVVCAVAAAAFVSACTPEAPAPAVPAGEAVAPEPTPPSAAAISLAGKWEGTITCYKIESPLQMVVDAARPGEATLSKGEGGALSWPATVSINDASRMISMTSVAPSDEAQLVEGLLSEDGATISGAMEKQLCTDFALKRVP